MVTLTKQIIEAKSNKDLYPPFEELKTLYFNEHKYNELIEFLNSLVNKKKTIEPVVDYYIALTRYYQLKHLEETQSWDEYFSQANTYREQIVDSSRKTITSLSSKEPLHIYARLILWKFHQDQQDTLSESSLSELMSVVLEYAKDTQDLKPIKDVAGEFFSYGEKAKASQLYRIYVDKLSTSDIKDDVLKTVALGFYKEGNLQLSQLVYDLYLERIAKTYSKEKLIPILIEIAQQFSYNDETPNDPLYAEKTFKKIEDLLGKDAFDEELMYLRGFNLEKIKEYAKAKDIYLDLVLKFPQTTHYDEAVFKVGMIYTYILRDLKNGRDYFEKLAEKEKISPQVISSLYQLGLLSHWEGDFTKAKDYYHKLIEKSGDNFPETVTLSKERLKEIEEATPIEYNLKTFLDVSLKEEYSMFEMTKLDLKAHPAKVKIDEDVRITSLSYIGETGCLSVALQYLWSGHLGKNKPSSEESTFNTTYTHSGTKEINLVVVSPAGIIDRSFDLVNVY